MLESDKYYSSLIRILGFIRILHVFDFVIMMPLAPFLNSSFGLSTKEFSLLIVAYSVSSSFFGLIATKWIDSYDRKTSILFCLLGFLLGLLFCVISTSFYSLLFGRVLAGAFGGILNALLFTVVADVLPENKKGKANAVLMSAFSICSIVGVPVALYMAVQVGWRHSFSIIAILTLIVTLYWLFRVLPIKGHLEKVDNFKPQIHRIFLKKEPIYALALNLFLNFSVFLVVPFKAIFILKNLNFSEDTLSWVYLVGGVLTFIVARMMGLFSSNKEAFRLFYASCVVSIFAILLLTQLESPSYALLLFATSLFMALSSGRYVPAMTLLTSSVSSRVRGSFMSLQNALQHVSTGLATLLAGWMISEGTDGVLLGFQSVGYLSVLFTGLSMFAAFLLSKKTISS